MAPAEPPPIHRRPGSRTLSKVETVPDFQVSPGAKSSSSAEQDWITQRFCGLAPLNFTTWEEDILICAAPGLEPPQGFQDIWWCIKKDFDSLVKQVSDRDGPVLFLMNVNDAEQLEMMTGFLQALEFSPILVLVPHSTPELCRHARRPEVLQQFIDLGIHDVVVGEPEGFKLACEVQARLQCQSRRMFTLHGAPDEQTFRAEQELRKRADSIREAIDYTIWGYFRIRLDTNIPGIDSDIADGDLAEIHNFQCGIVLGKGGFGKVFRIQDKDQAADSSHQVMKSVLKDMSSLSALKALANEVKAMRVLSLEEWHHENIALLHEVYHSETHVFLRMDYGGPENLHQRLSSRDKKEDQFRPLSSQKVTSIMQQCAAAIAHMHTGPGVAHRDIKPANVIVSETEDSITIKFADFGLAKIAPDGTRKMSSDTSGTFPFMAPEITLRRAHDVFAADVWSLGILFMEILCFVRFVHEVIFKAEAPRTTEQKAQRHKNQKVLAERLFVHFGLTGGVADTLAQHLRLELEALLGASEALLDSMLNPTPMDRSSAKDIVELSRQLSL